MADERFTLKSLPCAFACVEIANIYFLKEDLSNAIDYLRRAIDIFLEMNYDKFDYVSGLFLTLSQYYHQCENTSEEIKCLQKVRDIYGEIYGPADKKVIKIKR